MNTFKRKAYVIEKLVSFLMVLLFVYASVSKILDFQNFSTEMGQSPLLSAFAHIAAPGVLVAELFLAVLLSIPSTRRWGLLLSFSLMCMFTAYIIIILNFSDYVPCSCGGVLQQLGWKEHILFNLAFVGFAAVGFVMSDVRQKSINKPYQMKKSFLILAVSLLASTAIVVGLFMSSEAHINKENPFIRTLVPSSAEPLSAYPLGGAGYYIAGTDRTTLYLGNRSAPLYLIALNTISGDTVRHKISLEKYDLPFRSVTIQVVPPYFFLYDGTVPVIFKGGLSNLKGHMMMDEKVYFTAAEVLSDTSIAVRGFKGESGENILGLLSAEGRPTVKFSKELLVKQLDGIFDTDGKMHYCRQSSTLVYLYFYRNEYIVTDSLLQLKSRGQTIDTVSTANLNIVTIPDSGDTKLAAPPKMVNRDFLIHGNLMFVNSLLRGRHESAKVWQQASAVDIYDLNTNTYLSSFYIYNEGRNTPKDFTVIGDVFYAITGTSLQRYKLDKSIMDKMQK